MLLPLSLRIQAKAQSLPANAPPGTTPGLTWTDPATNLKSSLPPGGIHANTVPGTMTVMEGATVDDIANGLNALGARPRDLVAIFQALQSAGALHAELVEM